MEAPNGRRKILLAVIIPIVVVAVIAAVVIGVVVATKAKSDESTTALDSSDIALEPKIIAYDDVEGAEPGHWQFVLDGTEEYKLNAIYDDFHTKPDENWTVTGSFSNVGIFSMKCSRDVLINSALPLPSMQQYVRYIEPVYTRTVSRTTTLWGLDRLDQTNPGQDGVYTAPNGLDGTGVNVYILDTGILPTHTQFGARVKTGMDFVGDGRGTVDCQGHGTHVAGTVGGSTFGVANNVNLIPVRVLGCDGSGSSVGVMNGINWVTANAVKPAVASMSLGGGKSTAENAAVERAIAAGIPFSIAAGNENQDACNTSPASATNAITVGAMIKNTDTRASFSNWGTCLDIFAPGQEILSCGITSNTATATLSGTSMAAPHVSGVMALILQKNPTFTAAQVNSALINGALTGKVVDPKGSVNKLLNVAFLAGGTTPAPAPTPTPTPAPTPVAGTKTETGTLAARGAVKFHPGGVAFTTTAAKTLTATLTGPAGADFDLALLRLVNNVWRTVAVSQGSTANEAISSAQPAGTFAWRVADFAGSGAYSITFTSA